MVQVLSDKNQDFECLTQHFNMVEDNGGTKEATTKKIKTWNKIMSMKMKIALKGMERKCLNMVTG